MKIHVWIAVIKKRNHLAIAVRHFFATSNNSDLKELSNGISGAIKSILDDGWVIEPFPAPMIYVIEQKKDNAG